MMKKLKVKKAKLNSGCSVLSAKVKKDQLERKKENIFQMLPDNKNIKNYIDFFLSENVNKNFTRG